MKITASFSLLLLMFAISSLSAQEEGVAGPFGEKIIAVGKYRTMVTEHNVYVPGTVAGGSLGGIWDHLWTAPNGRTIVSVGEKFDAEVSPEVFLGYMFLLDDGTVYFASVTDQFFINVPEAWTAPVPKGPSDRFKKILGDAVYAVSTYNVFVTRDGGESWQLDTVGLGANFSRPTDIAIDSAQFVYLAHERGLFKQHPDSNVWNKLSSYPFSYTDAVYIDRFDRIFAVTATNLYYSSDHGSSWTANSSGLESASVREFGEDESQNLYATNGTKIFKSVNGTGAWTRIDEGISAITINPATINSIGGDSVLFAATNYGLFASADQGATWEAFSEGIRSENLFDFAKVGSASLAKSVLTERLVASSALGVFVKQQGETTWTKTLPAVGHSNGWYLSTDDVGNLYAHRVVVNSLSVYKSVDDGLTWIPDTLGAASTTGDQFYIDRSGDQYRATNSYCGSCYAKLYRKPFGGSWQIDTAGFYSSNYNAAAVLGGDGLGNIYVSGIYGGRKVWRRSTAGLWSVDSAGIPGYVGYFDKMTRYPNGDLVAVATYYIVRRNASTGIWSLIPSPPGLTSASVTAVSVDSSSRLLAAFQLTNGGGTFGRGVYYSTDVGGSWTYAGLDSIKITQLISYGDTTYALTDGRGVYAIGLGGGGGPVTHTITASIVGSGTIVPSGAVTVTSGGNQSFSIHPSPGYHIDSILVDGVNVGLDTTYVFVGVTSTHTIVAHISPDAVEPSTVNVSVAARWNLVSLPVDPSNKSVASVFPSAPADSAFSFSGTSYLTSEQLIPGAGYWLKFGEAETVPITGTQLSSITVAVAAGWNIIGSVSNPVIAADITSDPGSLVTSEFFSYDGRYRSAATIEPGKGYWVRTASSGTLILSSTSHSSANRIQIMPQSELPPSPPLISGEGITGEALSSFMLHQNYPNPFNPTTTITFTVARQTHVSLRIFNLLGQEVHVLADGIVAEGKHEMSWNARNLPTGIYFYRLRAADFSATGKLVLAE